MNWYALRTKPHKERFVWQQAQARDLEAYFPQLPANPVNPRARKQKPFFPGYVFVRADIEQFGLSEFQYMPYTHGLVFLGGEPASIPETFMHALQRRENELKQNGSRIFDEYCKGDQVWIQNGPFSGYNAIFDTRLGGQERVRVLLNMLNDRHMPVELNVGFISKAPA
jgi:transcriptional antiterminator RfaH